MITLAGVTHKDLLLNSDIALPVLQVNIELSRFFLFAPILLLLLHLGLLGQLVLLARKTLEFAAAIRMLEISDQRTHPLRLELDNFFFVQAMAGPERSRVVSASSRRVVADAGRPARAHAALRADRVPALPRRRPSPGLHRLAVLADIVLLLLIGVFLTRPEVSFFRAFRRTGVHNPGAAGVGGAAGRVAASRVRGDDPGRGGGRLAVTSSTERSAIERGGRYVFG